MSAYIFENDIIDMPNSRLMFALLVWDFFSSVAQFMEHDSVGIHMVLSFARYIIASIHNNNQDKSEDVKSQISS